MGISSTGQISFQDLQTEFGGDNPISLSEYYSDATTEYTNGVSEIPNIGFPISLSIFRGKARSRIVEKLLDVGSGGTLRTGSTTISYSSLFSENDIRISDGSTTVTVNSNNITIPQGYQILTITSSGQYTFIAAGGAGNNSNASSIASGAVVSTTVQLTAGDIIIILVGKSRPDSGGGGTFITKLTGNSSNFANVTNHTLILAAGGGAGTDNGFAFRGVADTGESISSSSALGIGNFTIGPGMGGPNTVYIYGHSSAGYIGNSGHMYNSPGNITKSFLNGGQGNVSGTNIGEGTFGGGAGALYYPHAGFTYIYGGGGGGYRGNLNKPGSSYDINGVNNNGTLTTIWPFTKISAPSSYADGYNNDSGFVGIRFND